jgi:hypothetical protein
MDRKFQHQEIQRLIRLGETARASLQSETAELRQRLDIPSRIRTGIKTHPTGWILGALGTGLTLSRLLFRRRQAPKSKAGQKRKSFPMLLLGLTLTAIRPFAKVWLTDQVRRYLTAQAGVSPAKHHNALPPKQFF